MPTPSRQLLSRTIYDTDGSTTDWEFAFSGGYLSTSHVKAQVTGSNGVVTEITVLPSMLTNAFTLRIVPALAAGSELTIYRDTPKDLPIVDFTDEAGFTEIALDTNAKQAIFVAAEATDAAANLTDASAAATTALQAADQAAASAAAAAADSASVNAALNVLSGFTVALRASGTGSQTVFPVAAPSGNIAMTVFVNGIYQQRNTWSFSGTVVTFTEAPVAGTNNIEFVLDVSQPITQVPSTSVSTQRFGVADGATAVTLEQPIDSQASVQGIYLNGLYQQKDSYSVNGDIITFVTPLEAGVLEVVVYDAAIAQFTGNNLTTQNVEFPAVGTTVSRTLDSKLRDFVSVKDFGAKGNGATDDTAAVQRAINYAVSLNRGVVSFPAGTYLLSATLTVPGDAVRSLVLRGAGHGATQLYRRTDYGDTLRFNSTSPAFPLVDCAVEGFVFYHDTLVGGGVAPMTHGAAVNLIAVVRGAVRDCYVVNHFDGFNILGGSSILFDHLYVVGYNGVSGINGVSNSGFKVSNLPEGSPAGTVPLPSKIVMVHCGMGGVPNQAANYCYLITGGEQIELVACEGSGARINNVRIEQGADNGLILEVSIRGGYYDTCDAASIWIGGPNGNGSAYIGNTQIHDAIIKASGFGNAYDGIYVDGLDRGGVFPQAVRGLQIVNNVVTAFIRHGININGGTQILVSGNVIRGNNYNNTQSGCGVVIGGNTSTTQVTNNIIGGTATGNEDGLQTHGIAVASGALRYTLKDNDLRGNAVSALRDDGAVAGLSLKRISGNAGFNGNRNPSSPAMPASGVAHFNTFGSAAWVSIFGGTVSDVKLNGQTIGFNSPLQLPVGAGDRVTLTYTVAPSWIWWPE